MLEVIALNVHDAQEAVAGGADRVELVGTMREDGLAPEPELVEQVARIIRVRPMLRIQGGWAPGSIARLADLARQYYEAGAEGVVLGFMKGGTGDGESAGEGDGEQRGAAELDMKLAQQLTQGRPYTLHRVIDHAPDYAAAWRALLEAHHSPDVVLTAGSPKGVTAGLPTLRELIAREPRAAALIQAGGGLRKEHVPQLLDFGVRAFHVGSPVRLNGSFDAPVGAALVQAWARLAK